MLPPHPLFGGSPLTTPRRSGPCSSEPSYVKHVMWLSDTLSDGRSPSCIHTSSLRPTRAWMAVRVEGFMRVAAFAYDGRGQSRRAS